MRKYTRIYYELGKDLIYTKFHDFIASQDILFNVLNDTMMHKNYFESTDNFGEKNGKSF